jgi:hypothetical protein
MTSQEKLRAGWEQAVAEIDVIRSQLEEDEVERDVELTPGRWVDGG